MVASVQELILAAQAKTKKSPFSQLADIINGASEGYSEGLKIRDSNTQNDARRAQIAQQLVEIQQKKEQTDAMREQAKLFEQDMAQQSEMAVREGQAATAPVSTPPTPAGKFERQWSVDEQGRKSYKMVKTPEPKQPEIPNNVEEIMVQQYRDGNITLDDLTKWKKENSGGSFMMGGVDATGKPVFYNSKNPADARTGDVPGGGILYPKTPSLDQSNAGLYGTRANQANTQLDSLISKGFDPASVGTGAKKFLPNILQPEDVQSYQQLKRNFINATLRRESGATVRDEEMENGNLQYFPQAGDGPDVLEQKRINRQTVIDGLNQIAGPMRTPDNSGQTPPPGASKGKTVTKKQYSKSANKTKIVYSDGTEEIIDGQQ
jgi:hypothetical protein